MLGIIAEATAQRTGVKINYLSAPDEPAASTTSNRPARREMIETYRSMPAAARALWEKTFFPERVLVLKDGSYQILGWSPEVFAANAHKAAGAIAEMLAKDPRLAEVLSPYPIDPATKSFTPEGWQRLYDDVTQQVQNYTAGRTGSGVPLVVPKNVSDRGLFAPSLQAGRPLEQWHSDFISMLFNFKLPETPRITGGKLPLNIAGQEISGATLPGRLMDPVRPRGTFQGEKAAEQGIVGREILEVNPLRQAFEQAAKNTGVAMPSFIETIQRLNLNNFVEVAHAPEAPEFRGNSLTLSAGFLPKPVVEPLRLFTNEKELGFFPIGYAEPKTAGPVLNTEAARALNASGTAKLIYHGEPIARNLFAFGPKGEDVGSAFSRKNEAGQTEIYSVRGRTPEIEATLRDELQSQIDRDTPPVEPRNAPATVQFAPVFYSRLQKAVDSLPAGESKPKTGQQWLGWIARMAHGENIPTLGKKTWKQGIAADEVKWSGIEDALESGKSYTKAEVLELLKQGEVRIEEVTRGDNPEYVAARKGAEDLRAEMIQKYGFKWDSEDRFISGPDRDRVREADDRLYDAEEAGETSAEFKEGNLQLPGGQNYREVLFTLPGGLSPLPPKPERITTLPAGYEYIHDSNARRGQDWGIITSEQAHGRSITGNMWPSKEAALEDALHHLNYIAEANWNTATEKQRDGFTSTHWKEKNVLLHTRVNDRTDSAGDPGLFVEEIQSDWHQEGRKKGYAGGTAEPASARFIKGEGWDILDKAGKSIMSLGGPEARPVEDVLATAKQLLAEGRAIPYRGLTPDAPFKNTWHELAFRRLLRMAVDQGKSWLGWTTGKQQAARYDLSKQVDAIEAYHYPDGYSLNLEVKGRGGEVDRRSGLPDRISAEDLPEYVGKDLAEKIIRDVNFNSAQDHKRYAGLDLAVGGEGMGGFYDRMLVDYANKFGKKFGARVEDRALNTTDFPAGEFEKYPAGHPYREKNFPTVHSLTITPAMKASVEQGVAQFTPSKDPRAIRIAAMKDPETGEIYEGLNHALAVSAAAEAGMKGPDFARLEYGFLTNKGEFLDREEAFARAKELQQVPTDAEGIPVKEKGTDDYTRGLMSEELQQKAGPKVVSDSVPAFIDHIKNTSPQEWTDWARVEPGMSRAAHEAGLTVTSHDELANLRSVHQIYTELGRAAMEAKDYDTAIMIASKSQAAREAYETATGRTMDGTKDLTQVIQQVYGEPDYAAPMGETSRATPEPVQFTPVPKGEEPAQFAPDNKKWKLKTGAGGFQKAWIDPKGEPIQLGSTWHHEWLADNPKIAKKYNITDVDETGSRIQALKAGFARINYNVNSGGLTVEARAKDWPNLRDSVFEFAKSNAGKLDSMTVHLFNDGVKAVVDSGSEPLFRYSDKKKLEHLPLISAPSDSVVSLSEQATGTTQFTPFPAKTFDVELEKIRKGLAGGQTFDTTGEVWQSPKSPADLVSLVSRNIPLGDLSRESVESALAPYADLLEEPGVAAGIFAFSKDGVPMVSVDVNAVVDQAHRVNTLKFAKDNDQVAIWDADKFEEVPSGGKGDTRLKSLGEVFDALRPLLSGDPVDVPNILKENRISESPQGELGLGLGEAKGALSAAELGNMTKADIAARYPEAVIPRRRDDPIPSDVLNSPRAKAAGSREAAVKAFARKLTEFAKEHTDKPAFQSGLRWYSEFAPRLRKVFGKDAPIMAELLAGTSPNTNPRDNYKMAEEALEMFKAGKFEAQIAKFEEGIRKVEDGTWEKWIAKEISGGSVKSAPETPSTATFLNHWVVKFRLKPRKANGKLFGISSDAVLKILARRWLENTPGLKTQNFVQNLLGTGHGATIDLWADRTMRRVGYAGSKERWRILPKNATGVSDADFLFAQDAFNLAAKELGMRASSLQGGLWFAEKQLWADQGWSRLDLGDFRKEIRGTELRQAAGAKVPEQIDLLSIEPRPKK